MGLETTLKRPIVNTRDEPHADPSRYRRLHVIIGDANLSRDADLPEAGGDTALVLAALEAGALGDPAEPGRPGRGDVEGQPRPRPAAHGAARRRRPGDGPRPAVALPGVARQARRRPRRRRRRPGRTRRVDDGARRPRARSGQHRRPPRLGRQAARCSRSIASATGCPGSIPSCACSTSSTTTSHPERSLLPPPRPEWAGCGGCSPTTKCDRAAVEPPERTRAYFRGRCCREVSARPWWPPTGTP